MKSIFNPADNAELIARINNLTAFTPARWGKMNAAQMMAHMQVGMNIAFGNSKRVTHWIGLVFGSIGKRRMLRDGDFDKHIPTFKQAQITNDRSFVAEKQKLIALIESALVITQAGLAKYPHPYFGKFKNDEWARLNWKHFDHHLRQFGV